jgi:hypothetical protein
VVTARAVDDQPYEPQSTPQHQERAVMTSPATAFVVLAVAVAVAGCGGSSTAKPSTAACLTQAQIDQRVQKIANGVETSDSEVAEKQAQIREVRTRAC